MAQPQRSSNKAFKWGFPILWALFVCELLYIFFVLLNYDLSWMNAEKCLTHRWILSNGHSWRVEDFGRALNIEAIEFDPHRLSRPLSNLCEVINAKFRANLWDYIPPHPSLSFLWPLFFIVLPVCLYRFFVNVGCNAELALGGCMLYMATIGYLGPIVMLFHPAKSLANLCGVVTLWVASVVCCAPKPRGWWWMLPSLMLSMLATFLSDETGVFFYVVILCLFICSLKRLWPILLIMPSLYFVTIRFFLPWLHMQVRGRNAVLHDYKDFPSIDALIHPNWDHVRQNSLWLLGEHPGLHFKLQTLWAGNKFLWALHGSYLIVFTLFLILLTWSVIRRKSTGMLWGAWALIVIYVFFLTFQLSTNARVWGVWWYGSIFSMLFTIWVVLAMKHVGGYLKQGLATFLLRGFIIISVLHTIVFSTYEVDVLTPRAHHPLYAASEIFNGEMKEYYRDFNLFDSMKRSHCIYLSALGQWADVKHKHIGIKPEDRERCASMLDKDPSYAYQAAYLSVELPIGK